jgi:SAM-dependent methyltransferase
MTTKAIQSWEEEVQSGGRFQFGDNWAAFLKLVDEDRIVIAEDTLKDMLGVKQLTGKRFIDVGSGSGLFSLAARRLGAEVTSFDYDPQSVACTTEMRRRYFPDDPRWRIERGSVLDREFLDSLGRYDIVYSWGVLHHTGAMWEALDNVVRLVAEGGRLYIAIYNDQGRSTRIWTKVKRAYVRAPGPLKWGLLLPAMVRLWGPSTVRDLVRGKPFRTWRTYSTEVSRGMDPWRDVVDWVGGYPFEVAKPEQILDFYRGRGFELLRMTTCAGGHGCNEFVFASR